MAALMNLTWDKNLMRKQSCWSKTRYNLIYERSSNTDASNLCIKKLLIELDAS